MAAPSVSRRIALFVLHAALDVGAHQGPLTAGAHEADDVLHQRIVGKLARDQVNSVGKDTIAKEKPLVRLASPMQRDAGDAATAQANDSEPSKRRDLALGKPNGTMLPVTPLTPPTITPSPICAATDGWPRCRR